MLNRASVTMTHRDREGNAGMTEQLGDYLTVDEAKGHAEAYACLTHPEDSLHWRQFSPTTWGLMSGQRYTYILVSWLGDSEPADA